VNLGDFLATWRGLTRENRIHRITLLGLIVTNLLTAVALLHAERTVVLVPPRLEGQVNIARDRASQEVKES
jgi:conjugal transfer pilus assembly protein TraE